LKRKWFAIGIAVLSSGLFLLSATAFADGSKRQIEVWLNTLTIVVNGHKVQADNLLYQGTTYVPLREISEKLGKNIEWNNDNKTVYINSKSEEKTHNVNDAYRGNSISNLANNGLVAAGENAIYIVYKDHVTNASDKDGLYKITNDDKRAVKLTDHIPKSLNLVGNTLYFADNGIYQMATDGRNLKKLAAGGSKVTLVDDWLYYETDNGIYKMRKDRSEQTKLTDKGNLVDVIDGKLFYISDRTLYQTDTNNGTKKAIITFSTTLNRLPAISNEMIYFADLKSLYCVDKEGRHLQTIYTTEKANLFAFYVDELSQSIWITEGDDGNHGGKLLVKTGLDGSNKQTLGEGGLNIFRASDKIVLSDFSAGYNTWSLVDADKRERISFE
jgi:hypothetical protein